MAIIIRKDGTTVEAPSEVVIPIDSGFYETFWKVMERKEGE